MARTRIKICGIKDSATAQVAANAGADAIGLVFVEKSPRHIDPEIAKQIVQSLPAFVEPVGLFVNEKPQKIRKIANHVGLRTVQLHGHETLEEVNALSDFRVLKAVTFSNQANKLDTLIQTWRNAPKHLIGLLWDAMPNDQNNGLLGGTGHSFDWDELAKIKASGQLNELPNLILAGGLKPENVATAIRTLQPYAVDVSSGVESSRGVKDHDLIRAFCKNAINPSLNAH